MRGSLLTGDDLDGLTSLRDTFTLDTIYRMVTATVELLISRFDSTEHGFPHFSLTHMDATDDLHVVIWEVSTIAMAVAKMNSRVHVIVVLSVSKNPYRNYFNGSVVIYEHKEVYYATVPVVGFLTIDSGSVFTVFHTIIKDHMPIFLLTHPAR